MENKIAVHENINSDRVAEFVNVNSLKQDICNLIESGKLQGLFVGENGEICAINIFGFIHTGVTSNSLPVAREIVKELNKIYKEDPDMIGTFIILDYDDESDETIIINTFYNYVDREVHIRVKPNGAMEVSGIEIRKQTFYSVSELLHAMVSIFPAN